MRSFNLFVAVARDGTRFVQEQGESKHDVEARCRAYEDKNAKALQDAVVGHAQFYGKYAARKRSDDAPIDVFCDYQDLYVHIIDHEGVAAVNAYMNAMTTLYDEKGIANDKAPINLITEEDIGKTVILEYQDYPSGFSRATYTLDEEIKRLTLLKNAIELNTKGMLLFTLMGDIEK